ncbi:MAG: hypothetical protein KF886_02405 [Candidatus Hydrogenedentes bacterium]|nr:hypothetical protein [Candidatus Hydrogenedentota bacterium]
MRHWIYLLAFAATACAAPAEEFTPAGVTFHQDTLFRSDGRGDNWCITWAADGSQITSMCDGDWLREGTAYHNRLYRLAGGPEDFKRSALAGYPEFVYGRWSWFGYGIVAADGAIYSALSKTPLTRWSGPFRGIKLLRSDDSGATWSRVGRDGALRPLAPDDEAWNEVNADEMFFFEECGIVREEIPAYPFSFIDFVQYGQDNRLAKDNYIYIHAPEGARAHQLMLARAPRDRLGERDAWEYFVRRGNGGEVVWSADIAERGPVHEFPETGADGKVFGWYSWLPSVLWNEPLGVYLMVNGGTYGGRDMTAKDKDYYDAWMHTETGSLGFWYAEDVTGPWRQFYYTDRWIVDSPDNRTYQPKLSPKWISEDGRDMVLIWSDAMRNADGRSHTVNYVWNHMRITIEGRKGE